jgi:hypothetical protein
MKRGRIPTIDPVVRDLALVLVAAFLMSVAFIATGYMVFIKLAGPG